MNEEASLIPGSEPKGYLNLPFDSDQFSEFLVGLLGKPQRIERYTTGCFEIGINEILDFHHLIEQRVFQQNKAKLLQFRAKLFFDDKSSLELNSFEELKTYKEIRAIRTMRIKLSWDYLIQFADKLAPEKQTIDVGINTNRVRVFISELEIGQISSSVPGGLIEIGISHTARTWAADVEAMLMNHIENIKKVPNKVHAFLSTNSGKIGLGVGLLFIAASLLGGMEIQKRFLAGQVNTIGAQILLTDVLEEKVNILSTFLIGGGTSQLALMTVLYLVLVSIGALVIGFWISSSIELPERSFILLTRKDHEYKQEIAQRDQRSLRRLIISALSALLLSIVSNFLYYYLALWIFRE